MGIDEAFRQESLGGKLCLHRRVAYYSSVMCKDSCAGIDGWLTTAAVTWEGGKAAGTEAHYLMLANSTPHSCSFPTSFSELINRLIDKN